MIRYIKYGDLLRQMVQLLNETKSSLKLDMTSGIITVSIHHKSCVYDVAPFKPKDMNGVKSIINILAKLEK